MGSQKNVIRRNCHFFLERKSASETNEKNVTFDCSMNEGDWTPYNGSLHMQGIKALVNNPCPSVKKEDAFEDTLFLIDVLKQSKEKENKQKKDDLIRNLALEQKKKKEGNRVKKYYF